PSFISATFFSLSIPPAALHSFPTRRSSDLKKRNKASGDHMRVPHATLHATPDGDEFRAPRSRSHNLEDALTPHDNGEMSKREAQDRKSTRLNSSHVKISYAVFCLKKKILTS